MKRIPLFALVGALAVAASACDVGPTAATVNGVAISQSALNSDLSVLIGNEPGQTSGAACMLELQGSNLPLPAEGAGDGTATQQLAAYQLSNMILAQLIRERLDQLGRVVNDADVAAARVDLVNQLTPSNSQASSPCGLTGSELVAAVPSSFFHQQVVYLAEQEKLAAVLGNVDLSTASLEAYYEAHPEEFQLLCLSDIAVQSESEATQIRQAITSGSTSFAAAAGSNSIDTETSGRGGQIGCVPTAQIQNQLILAALDGVGVGQISQPVNEPSSQPGGAGVWLLLQVDARTLTPFSDAQSQIRQELLAAHDTQVTAEFTKITKTSHVVVNPQYGTWSELEGIVESPVPPPARDVPSSCKNSVSVACPSTTGSVLGAGSTSGR
ncbi:MAG TPA: peptidylprolyl isomerase [Acidimicrobiales bacterium]|nr:peptidylprolyl isomerase [Acidimicrobiales bacterium]